uniref:Uncharacterized protein n=1 Tax=Anguilla anguilla TaxID=7936 RepID=A0A0E9Q2S0_ANGAN
MKNRGFQVNMDTPGTCSFELQSSLCLGAEDCAMGQRLNVHTVHISHVIFLPKELDPCSPLCSGGILNTDTGWFCRDARVKLNT